MKVVQLNTSTAGGAGVAALRLNRALRAAGIESDLLVQEKTVQEPHVFGLDETFLGKKKSFARFLGERLAFLPYEKDKSVRFAFSPARVGTDISQHPLLKNADVIHLHWTQFGFLSLRSLQKIIALNKPIFWTLHDQWAFTGGCHYSRGCVNFQRHCGLCPFLKMPNENDLSARVFEQKRLLFACLKSTAITFLSPSAWLGNMAREAPLTQKFKIYTVPNPIETAVFSPINKQEARLKLNLPLDKKLVLFGSANTSDPRKGFAFLRDAINELAKKRPDLEVVLFGKTSANLDLQMPVHNLGMLSEAQIKYAYAAADVMVVPSLEDNFPNTITESMACGTPVVGFETGGIPEQISHLKDGYVAHLQNVDDLRTGIDWVLGNEEYELICRHGIDKIHALMRNEVVANTMIALYRTATASQV